MRLDLPNWAKSRKMRFNNCGCPVMIIDRPISDKARGLPALGYSVVVARPSIETVSNGRRLWMVIWIIIYDVTQLTTALHLVEHLTLMFVHPAGCTG